jgi:hypothetical protein
MALVSAAILGQVSLVLHVSATRATLARLPQGYSGCGRLRDCLLA